MKKKNILIIGLTDKIGGVETFIYNSITNMDKNKYSFYFLVHGSDHCVFESEINNFYSNEKHIFFIDSIKRHPFKTYKQLKKFYKEFENKIDIIHLQTGAASEIMYVYPFCKKLNVNIISHSHNGNGYSPIINKLFRPMVKKYSNELLSCSNEASKWLFNTENVTIINNGVDTNRFIFNKNRRSIRQDYNINDDDIVLGHIGRFSEQKNHEFLIELFYELNKKYKNLKLLLVGVGELEEKIKNKVNVLKLNDKVIFAEKQSNTEDYYSSFDMFIMPSLYEGLPIVGIEAQCSGLFCLFSNNIDKKILLSDRSFIIELNKEQWIVKINQIINNKYYLCDREKYSKIIEQSGFSLKNTVEQLGDIYDRN